jgi:Tfp pilus assembly protein PilV
MRTFSARLRVLGRSLTGAPARSLASEAGDTLLEVLVSALLVGLIVVGTFSGLNSANRSTSIDRARSQADALAEQNEEQLHSLPVSKLSALELTPEHKTVEQNGTKFEVTSSAKYVIDNTATTSCSSTALSAEYIQTTSTVYLKSAFGATKPVVETGIVSPPPDTSLVVQVTDQLAKAVPGMEVQVTGPQSATTVTNTNGCAVLALKPGEYELNVHLTSYVNPNWFTESKNDTSLPFHVYLPAETTTKKEYRFAKAAELNPLKFEELNPETGVHEPAQALNATLENGEMAPPTRLVQKEGSAIYLSSMHTEKIVYPFPPEKAYTVYAGSCPANRPPEVSQRTPVTLYPGEELKEAKVLLPALIVKVWKGSEAETKLKAELVEAKSEIFLSETDTGCEETYHQPETVAPEKPASVWKYPGEKCSLKYPGQPWVTYTVCVNVLHEGKKEHYSAIKQENKNPKKEGTPVELYEGGTGGTGLEANSCP